MHFETERSDRAFRRTTEGGTTKGTTKGDRSIYRCETLVVAFLEDEPPICTRRLFGFPSPASRKHALPDFGASLTVTLQRSWSLPRVSLEHDPGSRCSR